MTTAIHLCGPADLPRLDPLVARHHAEIGLDSDADARQALLGPLLEGSPLGAVWLFGPSRAPSGYLVAGFGWSLAAGGMAASVEALFVRPSIRRRGIATEVLTAIAGALRDGGVRALHLDAADGDEAARRLARRAGFAAADPGLSRLIRPL